VKKLYIHIGYPKTGTTFLQKNFFNKHKQINNVFSNSAPEQNEEVKQKLKELMEISDQEFNEVLSDLRFWFSSYDLEIDRINLLSFEIFTSGIENYQYDVNKTLDRIKRVFEDKDVCIKIFMTIRNQREYLVSRYAQGSIKFEFIRKEWASFRGFLSFFEHDNYSFSKIPEYRFFDSINYYEIYKTLCGLYGEGDVKVFVYEKMKRNPNVFVTEMAEYFDINIKEALEATENKTENVSKSSSSGVYQRKYSSPLFFVLTENNIYKNNIRPFLSGRTRKLLRIFLAFPDYLIQLWKKCSMDEIVLSELQEDNIVSFYQSGNKALSEKLALDLAEFDYY